MAYLEQALSQGKHVLCEKSIPLNSGELDRAMKLAEERRVVLADPSKFSTITAASVLPLDRAGIPPLPHQAQRRRAGGETRAGSLRVPAGFLPYQPVRRGKLRAVRYGEH